MLPTARRPAPRFLRWRWCDGLSAAILALALSHLPAGQLAGAEPSAPRSGQQIYEQLCRSCHGAAGEGTDEHYPQALAGDKSVAELATLIDKTMPKDQAALCVGEEARRVAEYIHGTFYSAMARARNKPPRSELSRLTVRQYQHSLADLLGSFRGSGAATGEPGLRGEYFKTRQLRRDQRVLERVDPEIRFQFQEGSPEPGKIEPAEFSLRWQGSLVVPETGDYEFVLRTENGARLYVNQSQQPLIDVWVRSGSDTEFRRPLRLLGGRAYPIRLECFKFKEKTAGIELRWRRPKQHADEVISRRYLRTATVPEVYVVSTPFPPDDRSSGYERGASVSKAWEQAATGAALETAAYVAERLPELAQAKGDGPERTEKLRQFCRQFVERAFRRPLSDELRELYVERQFAEAPEPVTAVRRVVLLTLQSPRFLYPDVPRADRDGYDVAARLSLGLWDSLPDPPLLAAAERGELATPAQVEQQAERMATDGRARAKLADFFRQWLKVEQVPDIAKDSQLFPEFDASVAADLRTSLELFVDDVIGSESSDFRQLLSADWLYLNGRLGRFYGADLPADADFQRVTLDAGERAGVLTHPYLLAGFAYTASSSPIHRGVFIARSVLGRSLRQPPEAVAPLAVDLHPDLTTRERVTLQTRPEACQACHSMINPLGFTLEAFDAAGRLRREERGRPIDASGVYVTRSGDQVKFDGVRDLAQFLAGSAETREAFVEQLYHYLVKQPFRVQNEERRRQLVQSFTDHGCHVRRLCVELVAAYALSPPNSP